VSARIAKNSLWMIGQPLALNVATLLVTGFITRSLGEIDFGYFALAFAWADLTTYLTSMGLTAVTIRDIAAAPDKAAGSIARVLALRLLVASALALLVLALTLFGERPFEARLAMALAALTIPIRTCVRTLADAFSGFEEQAVAARCELTGGAVLTAASVAAIAPPFSGGLVGLSLAFVLGPLVSLVLLFLALRRRHFTPYIVFDGAFLRAKLKEGLPFFGMGILTTLMYRADAIALEALYGPAVVGLYTAATYQVVQRLRIIPDSLAGAIYPALAKAASPEERGALIGRALRYGLAATLPIAVGAALVGGPLMALLFGEPFRPAGRILAISALSLPLFAIIQVTAMAMAAMKRENEALRRRAASALVFAALLAYLAPRYGAEGTALAIALGLAVEAAGSALALRADAPRLFSEARPLALCAANLAVVGAVLGAAALPTWAQIGAGALAYAAAAVLAGVAPPGEIKTLWAR
jgi:lipopolysaccharide exporter